MYLNTIIVSPERIIVQNSYNINTANLNKLNVRFF